MIMHQTFVNATSRAADDLFADLEACRQLRHVSPVAKRDIVQFFFRDIEHSLKEGKKLPGTGKFFVNTQLAFEEAFSIYGYACDICEAVVEVCENRWRRAAQRALQNMDGDIRLMLCETCDRRFSTFCVRHFEREIRVPWSSELEQMMVAFIASELGITARRIISGNPPRKRKNEQASPMENRDDRNSIAAGLDDQRSVRLGRGTQEHGHAL